MFPRVTHPCATAVLLQPFDLHVLSLPPAFVLSQNQTLKFEFQQSLYWSVARPQTLAQNLPILLKLDFKKFSETRTISSVFTAPWTYANTFILCTLLCNVDDIVLLISTAPQLRKNWLAVTQRHLRLNALHTINLQTANSLGALVTNTAFRSVSPREGMVVMAQVSGGVNSLFTFFL